MASKEEYIAAAKTAKSLSDMCRTLGILPRGANMDTMKHKIALHSIDVSHFTVPVRIQENHGKPYRRNSASKQILIEKFGYKCSSCGMSEYNGKELTLQVDHIDGNNTNDDMSNIRLLCPNCHYETETYTGRKREGESRKTTCDCGNTKTSAAKRCAECHQQSIATPKNISKPKKYQKEDLEKIVSESLTFSEVLRKLKISGGGNQAQIKNAAIYYDIDFSHFTGQAWNKNNFSESPTVKLAWKKKLMFERGHKCEQCSRTHWVSGNLIPLELEHVDGNNKNNTPENLKLLCCNCHSQTKTWKRKKSSLNKPKPTCVDCGKEVNHKAKRCLDCLTEYYKANPQPSGKKSNSKDYKPKHDLCGCGQQKLAKSPQCTPCAKKASERIQWPPAEELVRLVSENSYTSVAKTLGVSDNAIRKHIKSSGVTIPTKLANRYTPEDYLCACGKAKTPEAKQCQECRFKETAYTYPEDDMLIQMINTNKSIIKTATQLGVTKSSIHKRLDRRKLKQYLQLK